MNLKFKVPKFSKPNFEGTPTRLRALLFLAILACGGVASAYAVVTYMASLNTTGTSSNVSITLYSDSGLTTTFPGNAFAWGIISPNQELSRIVYVKNTGNVQVTLAVNYVWANATQAPYFTVTNNYASQTITPGSSLPVTVSVLAGSTLAGVPTWGFRIDFIASG